MKKLFCLFIVALLFGCAAPEALKKQTTTGMPERLYPNTSTDKVKHALIDFCISKKLTIEERGNSSVICSNTMTGSDAVFGQLVFGNSYSTVPTRNAVFVITKRGNDTFLVMNNYYVETIMAGGQTRREPVDSNAIKNQAQSWIDMLEVEPDIKPSTAK